MVKKNGFTLAEVMIVLTVIGVISAIIMPIALHSVPDENVMKFKKANATLYQAVQELVNSDKYYKDGDLGLKPDGSYIDEKSAVNQAYFCNTMANILSVKSESCSAGYNQKCTTGYVPEDQGAYMVNGTAFDSTAFRDELDKRCKTAQSCNSIKTITAGDGIIYYEAAHTFPFGYNNTTALNSDGSYRETGIRHYYHTWDRQGTEDLVNYDNSNGFYYRYKPVCVDIDGLNQGEDPFGYGLRVDGKIMPGTKAKEWLEKDIQGE